MSALPSAAIQDTIVSMPQFLALMEGFSSIRTIRDIPIHIIFIKLRPDFTQSDIDLVMRELTLRCQLESVSYIGEELATVSSSTSTLNLIFQAITAMALLVGFFSLNSSMFTVG